MIVLVPLLDDCGDLVCHYAERGGGASGGPYRSLNLGFSTADDHAAVLENRRRVAHALGAPLARWIVAGQVHGADCLRGSPALAGVGAAAVAPPGLQADAVFLPEPGVFALGLSADCPLVVLADPRRRFAGIAHAGWRGTARGVLQVLLAEILGAGAAPEDLRAGISPGICGSCYQVGEEVFAACAALPGFARARRGDRLDLRALQLAILEAAGIPSARIRVSDRCSACDGDRFFSHRRDHGVTGRNGALVGFRD